MKTINTAVCPKIDDCQFSLKLLVETERFRVEPSVASGEIRDPKLLTLLGSHVFLLANKLRN